MEGGIWLGEDARLEDRPWPEGDAGPGPSVAVLRMDDIVAPEAVEDPGTGLAPATLEPLCEFES